MALSSPIQQFAASTFSRPGVTASAPDPSIVSASVDGGPTYTSEKNLSSAQVAHVEEPSEPQGRDAHVNGSAASSTSAVSVLFPPAAREVNGSSAVIGVNGRDTAPDQLNGSTFPTSHKGLGIVEFLRGKNILITGATGFLAKVLVEKILREQPEVGCLYLVIQPRSDASAEQRLSSQVRTSQIFDRLRDLHGEDYAEFMTKKVVAVEGNLCKEGLGIGLGDTESLRERLDVIVNSAATTTFDERYDFALNLNTLGPQRIMDFAEKCPNLKLFIHVSTAYVNGLREGPTVERPFVDGDCIAQELRGPGAVDEQLSVDAELALAKEEVKRAEEVARARLASSSGLESENLEEAVAAAVQGHMVDLGMRRAKKFGWQDTYVFTKAMGEMLISRHLQNSSFPVAVVRPSIVESSSAEPMRGWIEGLRMADPILLAYGKGQMDGFLANPAGTVDLVPADHVINALLAIMARRSRAEPGSLQVYHIATSVANPLTMQQMADATSDHFAEEPIITPREGPIRLQRMKVYSRPFLFGLDVWLKYQLPLQVAKLFPASKGSLSEKRTNIMLKTAQQLSYLAKIYAPYTFYACRFDASNTLALLEEMSAEEREHFDFDLRSIDWHDYLCHTHLPGLRKYVLKGRGSRDSPSKKSS